MWWGRLDMDVIHFDLVYHTECRIIVIIKNTVQKPNLCYFTRNLASTKQIHLDYKFLILLKVMDPYFNAIRQALTNLFHSNFEFRIYTSSLFLFQYEKKIVGYLLTLQEKSNLLVPARRRSRNLPP